MPSFVRPFASYPGARTPVGETISSRANSDMVGRIRPEIRKSLNDKIPASDMSVMRDLPNLPTMRGWGAFGRNSAYYLTVLVLVTAMVVLVTGDPFNALFVIAPCLFAWAVSGLFSQPGNGQRPR